MSSGLKRETREGRHSFTVRQILITKDTRRDLLVLKPVLEGKGNSELEMDI